MKLEGMQTYKQYLKWYQTEMQKPRSLTFMLVTTLMLWVIIMSMVCIIGAVFFSTKVLKTATPVLPDPTEVKYEKVFKQNGSTQPQVMAKAVLATKKPKLMTAIAIKESNGNPNAIGDGGASKGAFQVQAKHWGAVSNDPIKQAIQSEAILDELLIASRGRLRCALAKYNGGSKPPKSAYKYADDIIRKAKSI